MTSFNANKSSQTIFHQENQDVKLLNPPSLQRQRSVTINSINNNRLFKEYKHRSTSVSNGIERVIGFIQEKVSGKTDEPIQTFDDLKKIK